jgi:hypothetical protein
MAVIISSDLVLTPDVGTEPLTHARIGYKKITGTITASTTDVGFSAESPDNEMTYSFWKPTSMPATWEIDTTTAADVNYMAIAAHTCGTDQSSVKAEYWDGAVWQEINEVLPPNDAPLVFLFNTKTRTKYRFTFTGSTAPRIGVVYMGQTMDMTRGLTGGRPLITLQRKTISRPVSSEGGQWLGRSVVRKGATATYNWTALEHDWYVSDFDPFVEHSESKPFFVIWNPQDYPTEVGYVWTTQNIDPSLMGVRDFMQVSMNCEGLGYD